MKKIIALLITSCLGLVETQAQSVVSSNHVTAANPLQEMWIQGGFTQSDQFIMIKGERVSGTPFLFSQWLPGIITLKDGRVYNNFKLKYDAYNQILNFLSGTDSLEVVDEIKEFVLFDSGKQIKFTNASEYMRTKKPVFYETLIDDTKGALLKSYKKNVRSDVQVFGGANPKYLDLNMEYFYYDKKFKKISLISPDAGKIGSLLHLSFDEAQKLNADKYDFTKESNLIPFFNLYFESVK
jgi:hypothetical protein